MIIKAYSTQGMVEVPKFKEPTRVGALTGTCILSTKWFILVAKRG